MADHHDDGAPPARRVVPAPPVTVYGLEVGLLDVGRFVALNGYADACRRLPFLSRAFHREEDYVVACKLVRYGGKQRTRLMSLARAGDSKRVALLLKVGAKVDAKDTRGSTALHCASEAGHATIVRQLLDKGADANVVDRDNETPLTLAIPGDYGSIVHLLLDKGADVNAHVLVQDDNDEDGEMTNRDTPLMEAVGDFETSHTDIVHDLLKHGASINAEGYQGRTPLHSACFGADESFVRLFLDRGADPRALAKDGYTPLHAASNRGREAHVRLLLDKGADINAPTDYGRTPLHSACEWDNKAVVRLLLGRGADVNAKTKGGQTPLSAARNHKDIIALLTEAGAKA
jgi:ankyrin repeat protein